MKMTGKRNTSDLKTTFIIVIYIFVNKIMVLIRNLLVRVVRRTVLRFNGLNRLTKKKEIQIQSVRHCICVNQILSKK